MILRYCCVVFFFLVSLALADTTINSSNKFAYGANISWINWRADTDNGASLGHYFCTGNVYSANVGWISLGHGPTNRLNYSNTSKDDYGLNIENGNLLRGFAYGANVGWINFESNGNASVDLLTGDLQGSAYGANVGWISLNNAQTDTLDPGPNTDGDGLPDDWELRYAANLGMIGGGTNDSDGDGMLDVDEYAADTDPLDAVDKLEITAVSTDGGTNANLSWSLTKITRLYSIKSTDALSNGTVWVDSGLGIFPPDAGFVTTRLLDVLGVSNRFYRAVSHVPLSPP